MQLEDDALSLASLGYAYAISGNIEEAEKTLVLLDELSTKRLVSPYFFAMISVGLGDNEKTMEFLQQCLELREYWHILLKVDPFWDTLRGDARFVELLKKVGLEN